MDTSRKYLSSDFRPDIQEVELKMQVKKLYNKMKAVLKNREKLLLQLRYGLLNGNVKTQRDIAQMLGIPGPTCQGLRRKRLRSLGKN